MQTVNASTTDTNRRGSAPRTAASLMVGSSRVLLRWLTMLFAVLFIIGMVLVTTGVPHDVRRITIGSAILILSLLLMTLITIRRRYCRASEDNSYVNEQGQSSAIDDPPPTYPGYSTDEQENYAGWISNATDETNSPLNGSPTEMSPSASEDGDTPPPSYEEVIASRRASSEIDPRSRSQSDAGSRSQPSPSRLHSHEPVAATSLPTVYSQEQFSN